jgi:ubiquinone/menaquinone biosynthesis C-methylase UbiE
LSLPGSSQNRNRFDDIFRRIAGSRVLPTIWRDVYGKDFPEEANPFSFVTLPELRSIVDTLHLAPGLRCADIGCGQGGPSLFVARASDATVVGLDSSHVALQCAAEAARRLGLSQRSGFVATDAERIGLRDTSVDGAMSIDALQLMLDQQTVLSEVHRILKPGGRLVFTTWLRRHPGKGPPFPVDYQPLLKAAGLHQVWCHEPMAWEKRELAVFAGIRENATLLRTELGDDVAKMIVDEAEKMPEAYPLIRRVTIVAEKQYATSVAG